MNLFRSEVFEHRKEKLHGGVHMALPVTWQVTGGLIFLGLIIAITFLFVASYSRIENVAGAITPTGGIVQIMPIRSGVVQTIHVTEGESVPAGVKLVQISSEERLVGGLAGAALVLQSLSAQEIGLLRQEEQIGAAFAAQQSLLSARITGLRAEITSIKEQINVQEDLVQSAKQELERAQKVAARGFISRRDILTREESYLTRQQQLSNLQQNLVRQQSVIQESTRAGQEAKANAAVQISALDAQRSDISQRKIDAEISSAYQLNSPISGEVTALTARVGQPVASGQPIMAIVPKGSKLVAELYVPSAAIGFIETGQKVGLALDAYPYQRFGTSKARISSISSTPVIQRNADGNTTSVFLVTATLDSPKISAYGKPRNLVAGMTLTANIITEDQNLFRWLFEPLFAVRNR